MNIYSTTGEVGKIYRQKKTINPLWYFPALALLYFTAGTIAQIPSTFVYTAEAHQTSGYSLQNRLSVIAECESDNRHHDEHGNVLRGISGDIGMYQISPFWIETAERLGYDIESETGNEQMARWIALNDSRGFENWSASYDVINNECWRDK